MDTFTVYDPRNGFFGIENGVTAYVGDDKQSAALFTTESAKRLLVDIDDPRLVLTSYTPDDLKSLPYDLLNTDDMLRQADMARDVETKNMQQMTANAFALVDDRLNDLKEEDAIDPVLNMDDLGPESILSR